MGGCLINMIFPVFLIKPMWAVAKLLFVLLMGIPRFFFVWLPNKLKKRPPM